MAIEDLRQRYLWIAKNSLEFLKDKGFKKKGKKYVKQKGDLIYEISAPISRGWLNDDTFHEFCIWWQIDSLDPELLQLTLYFGGRKNLKSSHLMSGAITPEGFPAITILTPDDAQDFDQKYSEGIKEKIKNTILPLFDRIHFFNDVIHLAEEEAQLERSEREFFPNTNIFRSLTHFYVAKGWKEKALEACDKYVETTPEPARELAEKNRTKYVKYFNETKRI